MLDEEKLKQLIIRESKLEECIDVCKCPMSYSRLQSELSGIRYKIECCKARSVGLKTRPDNFKAPEFLREY